VTGIEDSFSAVDYTMASFGWRFVQIEAAHAALEAIKQGRVEARNNDRRASSVRETVRASE
jgi:hypothetical protein